MALSRADRSERKKNVSAHSELCLMYALDDGLPHSQKQIAEEWGLPRTTLNTIVKRWEQEGLLKLNKITGKRREMAICLTEKGLEKVRETLRQDYDAQDAALALTVKKYSDVFVEALEFYGAALKSAYKKRRDGKTEQPEG